MSAPAQDVRIGLLQSMPIFGGIDAETLDFLLQIAAVRNLPAGAHFYHEGDAANSMFVLERGRVLLLKTWKGRDYVVKELDRGDCFGEVALIDLNPRNTTAQAMDETSAIEISAASLLRLYRRNLEQFTLIYMNMAREVCRRLREADRRAFETCMEMQTASHTGGGAGV